MKRPRHTKEHEERLEIYRAMVEASRQWRDCFRQEWDACMQVYEHKHYFADNGQSIDGVQRPRQDTYSVNMIHAAVNTTVASSFVGDVDIRFHAKRSDLVEAARLRSQVATCMWKDLDFSGPTKLAYKDSEIIGHGWVKLRWDYSAEERTRTDSELRAEMLDRVAAGDMILGQGPLASPADFEHDLGLERTKLIVHADEPRLEYVHYEHMLCDPFAPDMDNIRWIAQQVFMPLSEVKNHDKWDPKAIECVSSDGMAEIGRVRGDSIKDGLTEHDEDCFVEVIEFYDLRFGTVCHFTATGGDRFLFPPVLVPAPHHHPFVRKDSIDLGGRFYPMSTTFVSKGQQLAFDKIRTEQLRSLQHWVRQYFAPLSLKKHNPEIAAAIEGQNTDVLLWMEDEDFDRVAELGGNALIPRPTPQINADYYAMGGQVIEDFERSFGVSEAYLGGQSNPYESATATSVANAGQQIRAGERTQEIQEYIATIAAMMMDYVAAFQQHEEEIPVFGQELAGLQLAAGEIPTDGLALTSAENPGFARYNRHDLGPASGRNRFRIVVSARPPDTPLARQRRAVEMVTGLTSLAQALVQAGVQFNWQAIVEHYLREGFDITDPAVFVPQLGQPVAPESQPNTTQGGPARAGSGAQTGAPNPTGDQVLAGLGLNFN